MNDICNWWVAHILRGSSYWQTDESTRSNWNACPSTTARNLASKEYLTKTQNHSRVKNLSHKMKRVPFFPCSGRSRFLDLWIARFDLKRKFGAAFTNSLLPTVVLSSEFYPFREPFFLYVFSFCPFVLIRLHCPVSPRLASLRPEASSLVCFAEKKLSPKLNLPRTETPWITPYILFISSLSSFDAIVCSFKTK